MRTSIQSVVEQKILHCCRTEIQALKPGNVSLYSHGHGMSPDDFFLSAEVITPILATARLDVGARIYQASQATSEAVGCNTNLGIVLLLAPLIKAFEVRQPDETLQSALQGVLAKLTVEDANQVFRAIRIASPGGLGESAKHDVHAPACVPLQAAMQEAADRDSIARQYSNGFSEVFSLGLPRLRSHLKRHKYTAWEWRWAAVSCYLNLLSNLTDSHIVRKHGNKTAEKVRERAEDVESRIKACEDRTLTVPLLLQFDCELKREGINPGTSADLTVVSLLAYQLEDLIAHGITGWEGQNSSRE